MTELKQIRNMISFVGLCLSLLLPFMNFAAWLPFVFLIVLNPLQIWLTVFSLIGNADELLFRERFALRFPCFRDGVKLALHAVFVFLALSFFSCLLTSLAKRFGFHVPSQFLVEYARTCSIPMLTAIWITAVILAPITEELAFRHTAWRYLSRILPRPAAVLIPAVIFTLLHGIMLQSIPLFIFALYLQNVYFRRNSLIDSILTHGIFNLCTMTGIIVMRICNFSC